MIFFVLYSFISLCHGQQEILGISSFNLCVNIVPNANNTRDNKAYLNCSGPNAPSLNITTIDLRLTASGTSGAVFELNLTTVPTDGADRSNRNGIKCSGDKTKFENCVVTTPAKLRIESTKYVYFYRLRVVSTIVPQYCYVARFDTVSSDNVVVVDNSQQQGKQNQHSYGTTTCIQTVDVKYCTPGAQDGNCFETEELFEHPVEIATNSFPPARMQQSINYKFVNNNINCKINGGGDDVGVCDQCDGISCTAKNSRGTCRNTIFSFDSIRKSFDPVAGDCEKFRDLTHDDYATVSDFPISDPVPASLSAKVNTAYGDVLQDITCSGYNCGGIYNAWCQSGFYNHTGARNTSVISPWCSLNAGDGVTGRDEGKGHNTTVGPVGMHLAIYSLNPRCVLYEIDEVPGVLVTVTFRVTIDTNSDGVVDDEDDINGTNPDGISNTQEFVVNNLMGLEKSESPQGVFGARVVSVDTLDGYIGPALPGYIVMCGDPEQTAQSILKTNIYSDPRLKTGNIAPTGEGVPQNNGEDNGVNRGASSLNNLHTNGDGEGIKAAAFIDMRSYVTPDSDGPVDLTINPWGIIQKGIPNRTVWYPLGENLNYSPIVRPKRNSMWYYIPIDKDAWLGKGCNQIGMTDLFWNTNFQGGEPNTNTGMQQCFLSPFTCVPGYSADSFGGRSITGCLASAAFKAEEESVRIRKQTTPESPDTESVGEDSDQGTWNRDQIDYVLHNSLPKFYNPEAPNYWPLRLTDGPALAYDPGLNPPFAGSVPELSFEVLVDLAGTFVAYESEVPNGIILEPIICNGTIGVENIGFVTIENRGTMAGDYRITFECPGDIIDITDNSLIYENVPPGGNLTGSFEFFTSIEVRDIKDPCILSLLPGGGDVFIILDQKPFNCVAELPDDDDGDGDVIFVPPSVVDNSTCGCMAFGCWDRLEGSSKWDSTCFLAIVISFLVFTLLFVVSSGYFLYIKYRTERLARAYDVDFDEKNKKAMLKERSSMTDVDVKKRK